MDTKAVLGQVDAGEVRRIGERHAVMIPAREATVIDLQKHQIAIDQINQRMAAIEKERSRLEARRSTLEGELKMFRSLPIERLKNDPAVPQPGDAKLVETAPVLAEASAKRI